MAKDPSPKLRSRVAIVLKAMGDPHRLEILYQLRETDLRVKDLVNNLGSSQANISKHLATLKSAGLIDYRQEGVSRYYHITDPTVFTICDAVCNTVERRIENDASILNE
ncbi:metalloregulator ArsR/SmtB family transcription factor [bacterium]|nr:metalloregulator ArsR/SmtB family transcription factor [bacterium]MBU1638606.1 metalloregulator ArsR/SmtB family transcription factor [bacterium]